MAGRAALDAAYPLALDGPQPGRLLPHSVRHAWLFASAEPTLWVSITPRSWTRSPRAPHVCQPESARTSHTARCPRQATKSDTIRTTRSALTGQISRSVSITPPGSQDDHRMSDVQFYNLKLKRKISAPEQQLRSGPSRDPALRAEHSGAAPWSPSTRARRCSSSSVSSLSVPEVS
jgi:hypothetical protein